MTHHCQVDFSKKQDTEERKKSLDFCKKMKNYRMAWWGGFLFAMWAMLSHDSWGVQKVNGWNVAVDRKTHKNVNSDIICRRRALLLSSSFATIFVPGASNAAERAVGSVEAKCREEGNCLEIGELDGALGWSWGGKDRCDAFTDETCGVNGQIVSDLNIAPVPSLGVGTISDAITIEFQLGKTSQQKQSFVMNMGLYDANPEASSVLLNLCSSDGLVTMTPEQMQYDGFEFITSSVSFNRGAAILSKIEPLQQITIGIPSQSAAYAKFVNRNLSRSAIPFQPQPKPKPFSSSPFYTDTTLPPGMVILSKQSTSNDDEAFAYYLTITASSTKYDKNSMVVIGQLTDETSMKLLARLASLPTQKGLKGIIPGQNAGPPLVPVRVTSINTQKLSTSTQTS